MFILGTFTQLYTTLHAVGTYGKWNEKLGTGYWSYREAWCNIHR